MQGRIAAAACADCRLHRVLTFELLTGRGARDESAREQRSQGSRAQCSDVGRGGEGSWKRWRIAFRMMWHACRMVGGKTQMLPNMAINSTAVGLIAYVRHAAAS